LGTKGVALYLRVSTDGQSVANQRADLIKLAELRKWKIVATYEDAAISGTKVTSAQILM
jgi:DNA invertase Pin-like site-specific DNA recombinase